MPKSSVSQKELKELLHYDEHTGIFTWKVSRGRVSNGTVAGIINAGDKYRYIRIFTKSYAAHRLAFIYMDNIVPPEQVDHINHNRDDNRFINLRMCSRSQNHKNKPIQSNNSTGHHGVSKTKDGKFYAYIKHEQKMKNLGIYTDINDAITARQQSEIKYDFHANHGK